MLLIQLVTMINLSENHENVILGEYYENSLGDGLWILHFLLFNFNLAEDFFCSV